MEKFICAIQCLLLAWGWVSLAKAECGFSEDWHGRYWRSCSSSSSSSNRRVEYTRTMIKFKIHNMKGDQISILSRRCEHGFEETVTSDGIRIATHLSQRTPFDLACQMDILHREAMWTRCLTYRKRVTFETCKFEIRKEDVFVLLKIDMQDSLTAGINCDFPGQLMSHMKIEEEAGDVVCDGRGTITSNDSTLVIDSCLNTATTEQPYNSLLTCVAKISRGNLLLDDTANYIVMARNYVRKDLHQPFYVLMYSTMVETLDVSLFANPNRTVVIKGDVSSSHCAKLDGKPLYTHLTLTREIPAPVMTSPINRLNSTNPLTSTSSSTIPALILKRMSLKVNFRITGLTQRDWDRIVEIENAVLEYLHTMENLNGAFADRIVNVAFYDQTSMLVSISQGEPPALNIKEELYEEICASASLPVLPDLTITPVCQAATPNDAVEKKLSVLVIACIAVGVFMLLQILISTAAVVLCWMKTKLQTNEETFVQMRE